MALYPVTLPLCTGSFETISDPAMFDRSRSNVVHGRRLSAPGTKKRTFNVVHDTIKAPLRATCDAFLDTNRSIPFTFTWFGTVYNVIWGDSEIKWEPLAADQWKTTLIFLEQ